MIKVTHCLLLAVVIMAAGTSVQSQGFEKNKIFPGNKDIPPIGHTDSEKTGVMIYQTVNGCRLQNG